SRELSILLDGQSQACGSVRELSQRSLFGTSHAIPVGCRNSTGRGDTGCGSRSERRIHTGAGTMKSEGRSVFGVAVERLIPWVALAPIPVWFFGAALFAEPAAWRERYRATKDG